MAGTITVSPRVPVDDLERQVRARVARDGGVELAATTAVHRQVAHLRRLGRRLRADDRLACIPFSDTPDGGTYLVVLPASAAGDGLGVAGRREARLSAPATSPVLH